MERLAGLPAVTDVASEHRYRQAPHERGEMVVALSQSGETADTLAALGPLRAAGSTTLAITNVPGSRITRDTDAHILTHAGPEIGVAATKTFTTQLVALYLLALWVGQVRGCRSEEEIREHARNLAALPYLAEQALRTDPLCDQVARRFHRRPGFLFLGRGPSYPVVMEGALKLKEISYIHAEAYPAGEMKHGPIALIDENMPVVALCPHDELYEKMTANLQEVRARDGRLIVITDGEDAELTRMAEEVLVVPRTGDCLQPLLFTIPLQLLAYRIGLRRGCDVDQPRNLAKSVTVE
jgi:glucosamine--fructose-6-phosphate aminotransferase (isomerizing)